MHATLHVGQDVVFVSKHASSATLVRGILDLELAKPTRVTAIEVSIVATWTTDWPAGIPPTYQDHSEMSGEAIVYDLLYSDKLMMALKNPSSSSAAASGSGANAGSTSVSPTGSGSSTPSHKHHPSRFTSVSNLLKSSLAASSAAGGSQQGVELPAGSYTCPFSFTLPKDAVPSISLPHGSRTYHLKAHIHRAGMLTPSVTRVVPFTVVLLNDPESALTYINVSHEDRWRDSLLYAWRLGSIPAFVLGETIPLELTFVPLDKVFVHKIVVTLHQKEMYRARKGTVEERAQRTYELLSLKHPAHHHVAPPLLPILPNSPANALSLLTSSSAPSSSSPTSPTTAGAGTSNQHPDLEYSAQLQSLEGPWNLYFDMPIPPRSHQHSKQGLHFTYDREPDSVIEIEHKLAIELHVSEALAVGKGKEGAKGGVGLEAGDIERITITVPVTILDVRVIQSHAGSATTSLPSYFEVQDPHPDDPYHFLLRNGLNSSAAASSSSLPIKSVSDSKKPSTGTGTSTPITTTAAPSIIAQAMEYEAAAEASTILPPLRPSRQPHPLSLSQLSYDLENTSLVSGSESPLTATSTSTFTSPPLSAAPSLSSPTEREFNTTTASATGLADKYPDADSKTLEQLRRFTQLIGGRVSVDGEAPPLYRGRSSGNHASSG